MKKLWMGALVFALALTACTPKEKNITFTAVIESVSEKSILVHTTDDTVGFDKASVDFAQEVELADFLAGQTVELEILPLIRESYPVQVTAVKITQKDTEEMKAEYHKITPEDAKSRMDAGEVMILDVRAQSEFDEGHIKDAILIPSGEIKAKAEDTLTDKSATILVYCRSGRRSEAAAKQLVALGYTNVYDFGGILDWPYETVKP